LGSPVDPHLALYDAAGARVAIGNDGPTGLDPALAFVPADAGTFTVAVMAFAHPPAASVRFHGGGAAVYRLRLGHDTTDVGLTAPPPPDPAPAEPLPAPFTLAREIASDGSPERIQFPAAKDTSLVIAVRARTLGSPLDAVLVIEDAEGKQLAEEDDRDGDPDPLLTFKAPSDGPFTAAVRDRFGRGGQGFRFQLDLRQPEPSVDASAASHSATLAAGQTAEVKVTVHRRHGHAAPLALRADGLPAGVTADNQAVPDSGGELTLTLTATPSASGHSGPFQVAVVETGTDPYLHVATATYRFPTEQPGGAYLIDATQDLWLTVTPTGAEARPEEDAAR
jgi:hypothetical protein